MDDRTTTIITSAAVGALVSSILTLLGQWLERRARREEVLLSRAIELALARQEFIKKLADGSGHSARFRDSIMLAGDYFKHLRHLLTEGSLPETLMAKERESKARLGEAKDEF